MDIRDWALDQIMQLPDNCFGRRWPISVNVISKDIGGYFDISEFALPEVCVVWSVWYQPGVPYAGFCGISMALGDVLPTTDAQFDACEVLFGDLGTRVLGRRMMVFTDNASFARIPLRQPIHSQGRRLVGRLEVALSATIDFSAGLVISSIPTEVPDCLLSR